MKERSGGRRGLEVTGPSAVWEVRSSNLGSANFFPPALEEQSIFKLLLVEDVAFLHCAVRVSDAGPNCQGSMSTGDQGGSQEAFQGKKKYSVKTCLMSMFECKKLEK